MTIFFEMTIKKCVNFFRLFHFTKVLTKPSLKGSASLSNIMHSLSPFRPKLISGPCQFGKSISNLKVVEEKIIIVFQL